jgi:hypothetical protein
MPQGSSAVRPTNGLYLYLYHAIRGEISQHPLVTVGHTVKRFNVTSSRDTDTEAPVTQRRLLGCEIVFER